MGFIFLDRSLQYHPIWLSDKFTDGQAWVDMLFLANYEEGWINVRGNRIKVKRGQLGWSVLRLSQRWQWSRGKTTRFLDALETEQQIVQQKKRLTSLITIVNYEKYQSKRTTGDTTDGQQTIQQTDTKKEERKKKKNIGRKISPDFFITDSMKKWAKEQGLVNGSIDQETSKFIDHSKMNGTIRKDWEAAWRNWIRKAVEFNPSLAEGESKKWI